LAVVQQAISAGHRVIHPNALAYAEMWQAMRVNAEFCANLVDVVNDVNNDVASVTPYPCLKRKGGANRVLTRERRLTGTFGTETVRVPRARIEDETGKVKEWRSKALPRYQRLTKKAEVLIVAVYLAGTNTLRVKQALFGLFEGADVVSRAWRKVKADWDAWCARSLADEDIVRLILDGTVIRTRLDRKATNISVLAAIDVRRDGQRFCCPSGTWAARARLLGASSSMTSMPAACSGPNS
jgi:transposase-like protein